MNQHSRGLGLKEGIGAVALVLVIATLAWLGAADMLRRARDTSRLAAVRDVQAGLEAFRFDRASYPATLEPIAAASQLGFQLDYAPTPAGCGPDLEPLCNGYTLNFALEGQVGSLSGGACSVGPNGLSCRPVKAQ